MRAPEVGSDKAIELLFAEWLVDKEAEASDETVGFYTDLVSRLFLPFFESVDGLTTASVDEYARHRLRLKVPEHYTKGAEKQKTRQVLVITW